MLPVCSPTTVADSEAYLRRIPQLVEKLPYGAIDAAAEALFDAYREDRTLFIFGNGGSAALASHAACDFGKGTCINGNRRFRVISLTDNMPLLTAWANDQCYEDVFAEQLRSFVRAGDAVLAISGSGMSPNVLRGLQIAREGGAKTIGLTGFLGGKMKTLCDVCIVVPSNNMQLIEDLHVAVAHSMFSVLRNRILEGCESSST
jgi:D-sedoheptulose 7-phosphate isomerase